MKKTLLFTLRIAALTFLYLVLFIVASGTAFALLNMAVTQSPEETGGGAMLAMLAVSFLNALVLTYMITRSRWAGWKLSFVVAFVLYSVMLVMSQIETLIFPQVLNRLPAGTAPALFLMGVLLVVPFAPLAVLIMGKWRRDTAEDERNLRLAMPFGEWLWKIVVIALIYVVIYFTFGYFVAWKNPAVLAYYNGTDPGDIFTHAANSFQQTPWFFGVQFLRGILWALIALPVIRMLKGSAAEAGLMVGLLFAVLMNSQLLLPNPAMPEAVRMAHLVETASSNFLFGVIVAELLLWRSKAASAFSRPSPMVR